MNETTNGLNEMIPIITNKPNSFIDLSNNLMNHAERIIKNNEIKPTVKE